MINSGGGAIYNSGTNSVFNNSNFTGNNVSGSGSGGAIYNTAVYLTINNSTFDDNYVQSKGGAIFNTGNY